MSTTPIRSLTLLVLLAGCPSAPTTDTPTDAAHGEVLALLVDGEAWSSSALALALGSSQRTVQRALAGC